MTSDWRGPGCIVGGIIFVVIAVVYNHWHPAPSVTSPRIERAAQYVRVERVVKNGLRDPDSAQFKHLGKGCGWVNAKNGFGGYTGFRRFIVSGEVVGIEQPANRAKFAKLWAGAC